ncbi:hypothetical protein [Bradyrhizobium commune]|uniref:Uncharacterized protein n=1 Tax=Bradyrhizobium commune TaxID=83627 RepID=A0A7S9H1D6_9BRAD|nr:hypothetical protein [Bradyrhizobium commune]QPF93569.1 hypothetical protein IC761_09990 [Bradyrhizobium commune]
MVGWLASKTTFSGHLRADLIRMVAASMLLGRSGNLSGSSGKDQPAISRRTASAPPTTTKYVAMGRADGSGGFGNLDRPMTAMLGQSHAMRRSDRDATPLLREGDLG